MATYLELIPDKHLFAIIALFSAEPKTCEASWEKMDILLALAKKTVSFEIKRYLVQIVSEIDPFYITILNSCIVRNDIIGFDVAISFGVKNWSLVQTDLNYDQEFIDKMLRKNVIRETKHYALWRNQKGKYLMNELYYSVMKGNIEIVERLIQEFSYSDEELKYAIVFGKESGHDKIVDIIYKKYQYCTGL